MTPPKTPTPRDLPLGTPVTFTHELMREDVRVSWDPVLQRHYEMHWLPRERIGKGFLVGYRTLNNGYTHDMGDDGREWRSVGHVRCALVVTSLYRNPTFVPLDALSVGGAP